MYWMLLTYQFLFTASCLLFHIMIVSVYLFVYRKRQITRSDLMIRLLVNTYGDALLSKWHFTGMVSFYQNQMVETAQQKHLDTDRVHYYQVSSAVLWPGLLSKPYFANLKICSRFMTLSPSFPWALWFVDITLVNMDSYNITMKFQAHFRPLYSGYILPIKLLESCRI